MNNQEAIYVVRTDNDGYAIQCKSKDEAQKVIDWIQAHSLDSGKEITWCKSITEDQLLADYSKSAEDYQTEAEALDDGYGWDDYLSVWLDINILPYEDWNVES